jgi:N-acetylglucosamine kinase-like BadF-type ATPase
MRYFLGIDVGGTKTHALLTNETGLMVGFGHTGPGNHEVVGYPGLRAALQEALQQAIQTAGIQKDNIAGAGFGIAGYDFPSERQPTLEAIASLGLSCPIEAVNDVVIGLIAGANQGWGVVVDAGTGCNVRGRDAHGREGWVTGSGSPFGEYGGAGDIVHRAVQAVAHHWSSRGPFTALSDRFIQLVGAQDLGDFIEGLALGKFRLTSEHARVVFEAAQTGDTVAREVIGWVAGELGETTNAVIRQMGFQNLPFEIVLIGSVFNGGSLFLDPLKATVQRFALNAQFTRLGVPPVAGGVLLGMELVGLHNPDTREILFGSAQEMKIDATPAKAKSNRFHSSPRA